MAQPLTPEPTTPSTDRRDQAGDYPERRDLFTSPLEQLAARAHRRRERIVQEIQANRRGEYTVPTWVLTAALAAIVLGMVALVVFL
jgi:hypothetical protein